MKKSDKPTANSAKDRKAQKAAEKSKKRKKRKIIIFSVLGVILALIIGGAVAFCIWGNDLLARLTGGKSDILDLFSETYDELQTDENGRINILAFGTSGFDMSGTDYDGSVHDGDELTDSIMVASINPDDGDLVLISIPRDFKVTPDCTAIGKINEVYWCNDMDGNNENAGAAALMTEVGEILGLDIPYYAHVNWGSLSSIIDAIGGINITLDEDIADYGYTDAVYQAGVTYTIDGAEAVGLARARHGTANGDFSRGASQQAILIGIKDKILGSNLSLGEIMGLANQLLLSDNLRTNFSIGEIKSLAHLGQTTDFTNIKGVNFYEPDRLMQPLDLPSGSYVVPTAGIGNFSEIQAYIAKVTSNDPRLQETETSILILNATGRPGVAGAEQTVLNADGYADTTVDDAPEDTYAPGYTLYALTSASPATTQFLESKYSTTAKKASALPEDLPSDYDFILIINN